MLINLKSACAFGGRAGILFKSQIVFRTEAKTDSAVVHFIIYACVFLL